MDGGEESRDGESTSNSQASSSSSTNDVWQRWTATFRKTQRMKNDLINEDKISATVERHMTLIPNSKKRSLFDDDDSDSDDEEGNYYKLDFPPRCHPLEFTPSGYLPTLGPQQVTPCDPNGVPTCSLRRYGHDDDEEDDYYSESRIPPPPSFHRYPSKKRAVGLDKPEPTKHDEDKSNTTGLFMTKRQELDESLGSEGGEEKKTDTTMEKIVDGTENVGAAQHRGLDEKKHEIVGL